MAAMTAFIPVACKPHRNGVWTPARVAVCLLLLVCWDVAAAISADSSKLILSTSGASAYMSQAVQSLS